MTTQWPVLSYSEAKDTYQTLHLCTQVLGKIKLARMPWINHSWHITLFVTPTGLTTGNIPDGDQHFQLDLNFLNHQLQIQTSTGKSCRFSLENLSVAAFFNSVFKELTAFGINIKINPVPNEIEDAIPLDQDHRHKTYNRAHAEAFHQALLRVQDVFTQFRAGFRGKCSPVHFFWGGFDMAVTRFSGRPAPEHPGGVPNMPDWVAREAYSHEVSSCGFWTGGDALPEAVFYSYMYPEPVEFKQAEILPLGAYYHEELREFILPYKVVQQSADPAALLLQFLQHTYAAGADLAKWDRAALETEFPDRRKMKKQK